MELKYILQEIAKITDHYSNIEKFSMRNAYDIGSWLGQLLPNLKRIRLIDLVEILRIG